VHVPSKLSTLFQPVFTMETETGHHPEVALAPSAAAPLLPPHGGPYPTARYTHEEIIANKQLFEATLGEVHNQLGIAFDKIPKVGGKELDLHQLYANVTQLGGCERVISRKQWRDAAESFKFAPTITSVSFTLRKSYVSFLWDYEQIYFFRNTGPRVDPPVQKTKDDKGDQDDNPAELKRRKTTDNIVTDFPALPSNIPTALTALAAPGTEMYTNLVGTKGTVMVDGRFDCGFFVTVKLGRQGAMTEFKGVLYYPPPQHTIMSMPMQEKRGVGRPRKDGGMMGTPGGDTKDKIMSRDPQAPKPNKTPFNFFSVDARLRAKELNPHMNQTEITKKVGEMWSKASDHEKAPYIALSNQDKLRYQAELEAYNYRLAAQAAQAQASQASQAVLTAQSALQAHQQLPMHLFTDPMPSGLIPSTSPMMPQYQPQQYHQQYHHEMPGEEDPGMS
jgi:hypothetical protein